MYRGGTHYIAEDGRYANFDADGVWTGYSPEPQSLQKLSNPNQSI